MATAIRKGEPGTSPMVISCCLAGLGERNIVMGINGEVALAFMSDHSMNSGMGPPSKPACQQRAARV